jgi:hypothetical protein
MSCLVPREETFVWLYVKMYEILNFKNKKYFSYCISWQSVLLLEETLEKTTDLPQVSDKL